MAVDRSSSVAGHWRRSASLSSSQTSVSDLLSWGCLSGERRRQAAVAFDVFLKVEGIPGDSSDHKYKKWIEVLPFSWGVPRSRQLP